ncbi:MAG: outer membrane beta-barrel protein [Pseudomonadales bacterium]
MKCFYLASLALLPMMVWAHDTAPADAPVESPSAEPANDNISNDDLFLDVWASLALLPMTVSFNDTAPADAPVESPSAEPANDDISNDDLFLDVWSSEKRGLYLGGGYTSNNIFWTDASGYGDSSERGNSDSGFIITGGYRIGPFLAVELGYLDGGAPTFSNVLRTNQNGIINIVNIDLTQETKALQLSGLLLVPLGKRWEVYVKAGAAYWDATSVQTLRPATGPPVVRTIDKSDVSFLLGVGVGVTTWERLHLRLEAQAFNTDDALMALDLESIYDLEARFDTFALEAHWRFGDNQ